MERVRKNFGVKNRYFTLLFPSLSHLDGTSTFCPKMHRGSLPISCSDHRNFLCPGHRVKMDEGIHQKLTEFLTECIKRKDGDGGEPKLACCSQILPLHFKLAWKNVSSFWTCPIFNCHVLGDNSRPRPPREYLSAQFVQNDKKLHFVLLKCREKYVQSTVAGVRNWIEIMARDSIDNFESRLSSVFRSKSEIHGDKSQVKSSIKNVRKRLFEKIRNGVGLCRKSCTPSSPLRASFSHEAL